MGIWSLGPPENDPAEDWLADAALAVGSASRGVHEAAKTACFVTDAATWANAGGRLADAAGARLGGADPARGWVARA